MKIAGPFLVALTVLFLVAPAHAGWKINRSLAIAQTVWKPTCGELRLSYEDPERFAGFRDVDPSGWGAWAWAGNCTIGIDSSMVLQFEELCSMVLHEAGHVAGVGHSRDRGSVMFAEPLMIRTAATINGREIVRWSGVDRRCLKRGRPFLERHGIL